MPDHIKIHGISLTAPVSVSPWPSLDPPPKAIPQPILISLGILHDISVAGNSDDLTHSINYSEVSKLAYNSCIGSQSENSVSIVTAFGLADTILEWSLAGISQPIEELTVHLELPKAVLRADSASVYLSRYRSGALANKVKFAINNLIAHTVVGINPQEREEKQPVHVNVELSRAACPERGFHFAFAKLEQTLSRVGKSLTTGNTD